MADEVIPVRQLDACRVSRCALGCRHSVVHLVDELAVLVDLDDPAGRRLGDHRAAVVQPLEGVDLERLPGVAVLVLGVVLPDDLPVGVEFDELRPVSLGQDVAVGEELDAMHRAEAWKRPEQFAVAIEGDKLLLVGRNDGVPRGGDFGSVSRSCN